MCVLTRDGKDNSKSANETNAQSAAQHKFAIGAGWTPCIANSRTKIVAVGVVELLHWLHRAIDVALRTEDVIGDLVVRLGKRCEVLSSQAQRQRQVGMEFPRVVTKERIVVRSEMAQPVSRTAGPGIDRDPFKKAACVVCKIQQTTKLIIGP